MVREITGFSNPLVKQVRSLREKKHRKVHGRFLAEGLRILTEALDAGILPEMLWYASESAEHPLVVRLTAATDAGGGTVCVTSADILSKLSGKDNPGSVIGVYKDHAAPLAALDRSIADIWIVAERLRDPGNLGTILRTADAVGAGGLILIDECTDPFSVEAVRASMGAIFTQSVTQTTWPAFMAWLRTGPGQLVGTSLNTETDYQAAHYDAPTFILVGNEAQGLPPAYEADCDLLVKMPMMGRADSLNAAIATAVMAYEVRNQWRRQEHAA
jgi:RNA methyltransferase, TrmH family